MIFLWNYVQFTSFCKVKVSPKYEIVAEKSYIGKPEPCILKTPLPAPGSDAAKNWANEDLPQFGAKKSTAIKFK